MAEANKDIGRSMQELARHRMIARLYADILVDMTVCDIEGWDKMEYIRLLRELLNTLGGDNERGKEKDYQPSAVHVRKI